MIRFSGEKKPVVMWNITRHCNLNCDHCYIDATEAAAEELKLEEGIRLIDELAALKIPMLILTGGEPLLSRNFYAYAFHAREVGPADGHLDERDPHHRGGGTPPQGGGGEVRRCLPLLLLLEAHDGKVMREAT